MRREPRGADTHATEELRVMLAAAGSPSELFWIALSIFLMGMSKGGFPVGAVTLPILVLVWPNQAHAAKSAVAFLLPLLCCMDIVALVFYRRNISWRYIVRLLPATVAGVAAASLLFVSDDAAMIGVSDRALKIMIGLIGLLFIAFQLTRRWLIARAQSAAPSGWIAGSLYGFAAGVTSTIAHAAGPVIQMYLLPRNLPKLVFAGTTCAFFFILNLLKVLPFALLGRIQKTNLVLAAWLLPVIPLGVALGYFLVQKMKSDHYRWFIYAILFVTSVLLILE